MRVKIIANKPIDVHCASIEEHIGKEFDTYEDEYGNLRAVNPEKHDFILFEGEYEIINEN